MENYGFIYETTNKVNGMRYIGKCIYNRKNNWESYLGSGIYLKRAIKKYGKSNFTRKILDEASSNKELNELEEFYIKKFNAVESPNYYNIKHTSIGGDVFTCHPRKEEIRKMRVQQMLGKSNHQYGKPKTEKMLNSVKESNSRSVSVQGVIYTSHKEASTALGINATTLGYRLDSDNYPEYIRLAPKSTLAKKKKPTNKTCKVEINGVEYPSIKEASESLGVGKSTVTARLNNSNFPNYIRL